jgi:hypothetical protein
MNDPLHLTWLAGITSAVLYVGASVLMQEVRSRLVAILLSEKSPLSMELSDWTVSGGRVPGKYDAIKKEFIWGAPSLELARNPKTLPLLRKAKILYVARRIGVYCLIASIAVLFWVLASGAR